MTPPKPIEAPDPAMEFYSQALNKAVFTVTIGPDGLIHDPKLVKSSGSQKADALALEAINHWTFKPATKDGVPLPVLINIEFAPRIISVGH